MRVILRPVQPDDEAFLYRLYAATRAAEVAQWGWDPAQQEAFLHLQFRAHEQHYTVALPPADQQIVECDGAAVGRMIVVRHERAIVLADIALLPAARNAGLGTQLITALLAEAAAACTPVRLHVALGNPALRLYQRLGFAILADNGTHYFMEKPAPATY